jgi:hypothetical protein
MWITKNTRWNTARKWSATRSGESAGALEI